MHLTLYYSLVCKANFMNYYVKLKKSSCFVGSNKHLQRDFKFGLGPMLPIYCTTLIVVFKSILCFIYFWNQAYEHLLDMTSSRVPGIQQIRVYYPHG